MINEGLLEQNILVIGFGSIGRRHTKNLIKLGFKHIKILTSQSLQDTKECQFVRHVDKLNGFKIYAVFICSITSEHIRDIKIAASFDSHVFIEKPICHTIKDFNSIKKIVSNSNGRLYRVGYMLRLHPLIVKLKKFIDSNYLGKVKYASTCWSEYLPDWHPYEDYRLSYAANSNMGGGVTLTLSHDIDLMTWLFNNNILSTKKIVSFDQQLQVNCESRADIIYQIRDNISGYTHLDFDTKIGERDIKVKCENGILNFNYIKNTLTIIKDKSVETIYESDIKRNSMFELELLSFFDDCQNKSEIHIKNKKTLVENEIVLGICLNEYWVNCYA